MAKKSYCLDCKNDTCGDVGKSNPFMCGSNTCSRFISQADLDKKVATVGSDEIDKDAFEEQVKKFAEGFLTPGIFNIP